MTFQEHYFPQRIVCLTEEPTETLYLLGEQDRIIGISGFTVRPVQARKEKPKVSVNLNLTIEEVNFVLESLSKQPFREVYKLIEKIHLQAKDGKGK